MGLSVLNSLKKQKGLMQWCLVQAQRCLAPVKSQDHISYEQHNAVGSCEKVFSPNFPLKQWLRLYPLLFQIYFKSNKSTHYKAQLF